MTEPITIIVPGKPIPKARPRLGKGNVYTPVKTVLYERLVGLKATQAMAGKKPFTGPVRLDLRAQFEVPKSWPAARKTQALLGELVPGRVDTDNLVKSFTDALNRIVYVDDSQIVQINARRVYGHSAHVVATIQPMLPDAQNELNRVPELKESAEPA